MMGYCRDCKKRWESLSECHCSGCHRQFRSDFAFMKHRSGKAEFRYCLDPEEMRAKGMVFDQKKQRWTSGSKPEMKYAQE